MVRETQAIWHSDHPIHGCVAKPETGCPRENHLVLAMMNLDNCVNDAKILGDEAFVVLWWLGCVTHYS